MRRTDGAQVAWTVISEACVALRIRRGFGENVVRGGLRGVVEPFGGQVEDGERTDDRSATLLIAAARPRLSATGWMPCAIWRSSSMASVTSAPASEQRHAPLGDAPGVLAPSPSRTASAVSRCWAPSWRLRLQPPSFGIGGLDQPRARRRQPSGERLTLGDHGDQEQRDSAATTR